MLLLKTILQLPLRYGGIYWHIQKEKGVEFETEHFSEAYSFLTNYTARFDIVLMDIELPGLNGMDAAEKLRRIDKNVVLIFITNMAQFAVRGYAVDAMDFIVKPVSYYDFFDQTAQGGGACRSKCGYRGRSAGGK